MKLRSDRDKAQVKLGSRRAGESGPAATGRHGGDSARKLRIALVTSQAELPTGDTLLAAALAERGFEVQAAIWHDSRQDWRAFDAVVVRSCWDYHLHAREFLEWVATLERRDVVVVNAPDLIRWNADKIYLAELAAAGIEIPDTIFVDAGAEFDLAAICISRGWRTAVVKPTISASAYRTELRSDGLVTGPALIQEYVAAVETAGEWSLVYFGGRYSHAVIKLPKAGDFRVQTAFGGTVRIAQPSAALRRFAASVLSRVRQPPCFARVDIIVGDRRILLMELEVIEPELFLAMAPGSSRRLAGVIAEQLTPLQAAPGQRLLPKRRKS